MVEINLTDAGLPQHGQLAHPLLTVLSDGRERTRREFSKETLDLAGVPQELREIQYERSGNFAADNRVGWAKSELARARLIEPVRRGVYRITDAGQAFLEAHPAGFVKADLESLPAWDEYVVRRRGRSRAAELPAAQDLAISAVDDPRTPDEIIDAAVEELEEDVRSQLLLRLKEGEPDFFERVVRQLLVQMGYGAEGKLARLTGAGDSGIDGVVDRDELGLSRIYIQAKRYDEAAVGRPAVQAFVGALATRGAATGVFFTTSRFTESARDAADRVSQEVALIDGPRLAELMIKHRVGVQVERLVETVRLDEDFFE